jgi:Calcineurin-like phosphoesterase
MGRGNSGRGSRNSASETTTVSGGVMYKNLGIAGDWHGNTRWALHVIEQMEPHLKDSKFIFQLGDFGYWPYEDGSSSYIETLSAYLVSKDIQLFFLDGNHENHTALKAKADYYNCDLDNNVNVNRVIPIAPNVIWFARGMRFSLAERKWLVCGGAASVDRAWRQEGFDWFPEEMITDEQELRISDAGHADVLLSHDRPAGARLFLPSGVWPDKDIAVADAHRDRMQRICEAVQPSYIMHGHYHMATEEEFEMSWGKVRVNGFGCDGNPGNWGILDTETMEWVTGG